MIPAYANAALAPISPNEVLLNGPQVMAQLATLANLQVPRVPLVPSRSAVNRFARRFKRGVDDTVQGVKQGATRYYSRKIAPAFAASSVSKRAPQTRSQRMASSFLMAGRNNAAKRHVPTASTIAVLRARAASVAQTVRMARAKMGLMAQRFNRIAADLWYDNAANDPLSVNMQARFANASRNGRNLTYI